MFSGVDQPVGREAGLAEMSGSFTTPALAAIVDLFWGTADPEAIKATANMQITNKKDVLFMQYSFIFKKDSTPVRTLCQ
jgi:hypothetical protein